MDGEFEVLCTQCGARYQNTRGNAGDTTSCGKCGASLTFPPLSPEAIRIDRVVESFDWGDSETEKAYIEVVQSGQKSVARLVYAMKGGTMRRFHAARALGAIGMNAQCGLIRIDAEPREAALTALQEAWDYEQLHESGRESEQICVAIQRAIANLAPK